MTTPIDELMVNDRGFAFDPRNGETFQLSSSGLRILRLLQERISSESILSTLVREYDVDEHSASRDLEDFLHSLQAVGWISK